MAGWLLIPAAYQLMAIVAILAFLRRRPPMLENWPAISVLKPTLDGELPPREAIESHERQDYPDFEIIYSERPARAAANGKAGKLMVLAEAARKPVWVVNDADIRVPPDYLRQVSATLAQPGVGFVTCLFRGKGDHLATEVESLGIAVDFMPGILVARLMGLRRFAMGSTLAFRKADLDRIGGFEAVADCIADDYQLAWKITGLGSLSEIAPVVVESTLHGDWLAMWQHQVRWARTVRVSKPWSYLGLPIAHAGLWAAVAAAAGAFWAAGALCLLRILMAGLSARTLGWKGQWFLAPVWDLVAFAIWISAWLGNSVRWQGRLLRLTPDGRISEVS